MSVCPLVLANVNECQVEITISLKRLVRISYIKCQETSSSDSRVESSDGLADKHELPLRAHFSYAKKA